MECTEIVVASELRAEAISCSELPTAARFTAARYVAAPTVFRGLRRNLRKRESEVKNAYSKATPVMRHNDVRADISRTDRKKTNDH